MFCRTTEEHDINDILLYAGLNWNIQSQVIISSFEMEDWSLVKMKLTASDRVASGQSDHRLH